MALPLAVAGAAAMRALPFVGAAVDEVKKLIPRLEDEVVVTVVGQPGAKKAQLYYLALAAACGLVRRYDGKAGQIDPAPGMLAVEYDAASNYVKVTLRYNTNLLSAFVVIQDTDLTATIGAGAAQQVKDYEAQQGNQGGSTPVLPLKAFKELVVYSGPRDDVVGREFNFTGIPGLGLFARTFGSPQLPWVGRTILTTAPQCQEPIPGFGPNTGSIVPTPDPKPPGDNRSRGAVVSSTNPLQTAPGTFANATALLIPMVFAALTDPGGSSLEGFPAPISGPTGR